MLREALRPETVGVQYSRLVQREGRRERERETKRPHGLHAPPTCPPLHSPTLYREGGGGRGWEWVSVWVFVMVLQYRTSL